MGEITREMITSRKNQLIIDTAKLGEKKYREQRGEFFFEGAKLAEEAVKSGVRLTAVFMTEDAIGRCRESGIFSGMEELIIPVSEEVYSKLSEEKSPQGVLCTAKPLDNLHKTVKIYNNEDKNADVSGSARRFVLCSVRDPGNLGAVIRSAAAFGVDELLLSSDCAELYGPKTLRASMGATFRLRITVCEDIVQAIGELNRTGYESCAAVLDGRAESVLKTGADRSKVFVVGNEGHGLDPEIVEACKRSVLIPMSPGTESLNASVAASLLLWEGFRADNYR